MSDPTEGIRRELVETINSNSITKDALEKIYGKGNVFTTEDVRERFEVLGFMAPYVVVEEKKTGIKGSLMFQHSPRFYFGFQED